MTQYDPLTPTNELISNINNNPTISPFTQLILDKLIQLQSIAGETQTNTLVNGVPLYDTLNAAIVFIQGGGDGLLVLDTLIQSTNAFIINDNNNYNILGQARPVTDIVAHTDSHLDEGYVIVGGGGNDTIGGSTGADNLTGGYGNDSLSGFEGNDTVVAGLGSDTVDGGIGFDVLQVQGSYDQWIWSTDGDSVAMSNGVDSPNIVDARNIDFISFINAVGNETSVVVTDNQDQANAMRLYQGLFDRSADLGGAQNWLTAIDIGFTDVQVAQAFLSSPEFTNTWGTLTNGQYVELLYQNSFNRDADPQGLANWTAAIDLGILSRAQVAVAIVGSPEGQASIDNVLVIPGLV